MSPPLSGEFGGVEFPLEAQVAAASLREVADAPLNGLLAFLVFFINADLGTALTDAAMPPISANIVASYSTDPGVETLKPEQLKFPAFFIWRKTSNFEERFLGQAYRRSVCGWGYILPPMTFEQAEKYSHICNAVELSFGRALTLRAHPDYNGGESLGFGIVRMRALSASREVHPGGELTSFYAVMGEFELEEENVETAADFGNLDSIDYSVGVGNATEIVPDLLQAETAAEES